ncbi:hypothetical protein Tco_0867823 [Tanacetum coccineum]
MNASECVSEGCALECTILSPTFKVRDFQAETFMERWNTDNEFRQEYITSCNLNPSRRLRRPLENFLQVQEN